MQMRVYRADQRRHELIVIRTFSLRLIGASKCGGWPLIGARKYSFAIDRSAESKAATRLVAVTDFFRKLKAESSATTLTFAKFGYSRPRDSLSSDKEDKESGGGGSVEIRREIRRDAKKWIEHVESWMLPRSAERELRGRGLKGGVGKRIPGRRI